MVNRWRQENFFKYLREEFALDALVEADQAESELVRTGAPHYRRVAAEGRTPIQAALLRAADLEVTAQELRVTLRPQSSPHRTQAIAALRAQRNALDIRFPGSCLQLRYSIHAPAGAKSRTFPNTRI